MAKAPKATTSPTVIAPCAASTAPVAKIVTMAMVAAARVRTESSPHQVSTGYWAARSSSMMPRISCISAARRA